MNKNKQLVTYNQLKEQLESFNERILNNEIIFADNKFGYIQSIQHHYTEKNIMYIGFRSTRNISAFLENIIEFSVPNCKVQAVQYFGKENNERICSIEDFTFEQICEYFDNFCNEFLYEYVETEIKFIEIAKSLSKFN